MTTTHLGDGTVARIVTDPETRQANADQAARINATYSLAGADMTAEQAAVAGVARLSDWDLAEMQKAYQGMTREQIEAEMQKGLDQAAKDRVRRLELDSQTRAEVVGGLYQRGLIDVTDETVLDDLPDDLKLGLPWHLRFTGPRGNGVTVIRKSWDAEAAGRAAKVLGWEVQSIGREWTGRDGQTTYRDDNLRTITRRAIPDYAADCRCDGFHQRPGESRQTTTTEDGRELLQPLCGWLEEKALGQCRTGWNADTQMEDLIEVLGTFTETGEVIPETIGWLGGGERLFIQMRLSDVFGVLGGEDLWKTYLGIHQNYTGHGAASIHTSGVRIGCDNTRRWGERTASGIAKVRHDRKMKAAFKEAGRFLLEAQGYIRREQEMAERLAAIELELADYHTIAAALIEDRTSTEVGETQLANRRLELVGHLLSDDTLPADLRRTGYGAREATIRWFGQLAPSLDRTDTARLNSAWDRTGSAMVAARQVTKVVQTIGGRRVKVRKR
jgi:Domain of unknown function (DUF932)